jgi:hypothetical protein
LFTAVEIVKLESKYSTINQLEKVQKDLDKKMSQLDDTQTYLDKQTGNLQ